MEVGADADVREAVGLDVGLPDGGALLVDDALWAAALVGEEVVAGAGFRVCVDGFVVDEEERDHGEGVGVDVDAELSVGSDLGGEAVAVPVVAGDLRAAVDVDGLLDAAPDAVVLGGEEGLAVQRNGDELVARVVAEVELGAVGSGVLGDVLADAELEAVAVGVAELVEVADGGLFEAGLLEEAAALGVPVGVLLAARVGGADEAVGGVSRVGQSDRVGAG